MYHSLIFVDGNNSRNTWDNWHLIPSSRPVVSRPNVTLRYVDVPGKDGQLDISDYLIGRPTYSSCNGSFEFYVANDYGNWASRKSELSEFLNGRKMKMFLEDDPQYYYLGRFTFKEWRAGPNFSSVVIEYTVEPYKYLASNGKRVLA